MSRRRWRCLSAGMLMTVLAPAASAAHVGSPDVIFDGNAGLYTVRVIVRPPLVVPGLADVIVRVLHGNARRVLIQPVYWRGGVRGAPSPDEAKADAGAEDSYSGQLWLMVRGAYSVYVTIEGDLGSATVSVPVNSVATGRLAMSRGLGALLSALGILLAAALVTVVHAGAGESLVEPGLAVDRRRRRRARLIATITVPVLAVILFGGAKWWQSVDRQYQARMYRPIKTQDTILQWQDTAHLQIRVLDTAGRLIPLYEPLMPDHGKLMHLFLIDSAHATSFAHSSPLVFSGRVLDDWIDRLCWHPVRCCLANAVTLSAPPRGVRVVF